MTQQRIRILNEITINQIAAGEVIENPASVVKELIENALDSGASEIRIETKAGGRGLIKIMDDGCGMGQDDLLLSIERHATSKLGCVEELNGLKTLGFRGEALPSIASVSKMSLHSATFSGKGHLLLVEGGKVHKLQPMPRCKGTTIEVRSLFFNVPVRKKYQKSINWDTGEIHKILTRFVLSYPSIAFTWIHDEKIWMHFTGNDSFDKRVADLLGNEFLDNSLLVEHEDQGLYLSGRITCPSYHRPNKTGQHLFINLRSVTSSFISSQVIEGYGTRLSPHRYPLFILNLQIPPTWIDVNVHPQKKEIRICEEGRLSAFLLQGLHKTLEQPKKGLGSKLPACEPTTFSENLAEYKSGAGSLSEQIPALPIEMALKANEDFFERTTNDSAEDQRLNKPRKSTQAEPDFFSSQLMILSRVKNYFFIQEAEGVRIVDVSRAAERVIYEELNGTQSSRAIQTLLIPIHMHFPPREFILLCEHLKAINASGISMRPFGGDTFIVDAIPSSLEPNEIPDLIHAYLAEGAFPCYLGKCLKRTQISLEAGSALIEKLFKCQNTHYTPSGKKIHCLLEEHVLGKML